MSSLGGTEGDPPTLTEMADRAPSREVVVRPRTLVASLATVVAIAGVVWVLIEAWQVLTWVVVAAFFAVALTPAVDALAARGLPAGLAVTAVALLVLGFLGLLAWAVVPALVEQTDALIAWVPDAVEQATRGRGPLGWLERDYGIVERVRESLADSTGERVLGITSPALGIVRGILTAVAATVSIFFLTLFMLLEGRRWVASGLDLFPDRSRPRWERILAGVTRTIRGYVMGNLVISLIAGIVCFVTLTAVGVPYAVPVAVLVAVLDLIPLVGATLGTVVAGLVALSEGPVEALVVVGVFVVYQQIENHLLQPVVYGRAVRLSPLLIAVSVLVASAVAGLVGALIAIPIAGSLQVIATELLGRSEAAAGLAPDGAREGAPAPGAPTDLARQA